MLTSDIPAKVISKLRKIQALAQQGSDGEKKAAAARLHHICTRFGINPLDIEPLETTEQKYTYTTKHERELLFQCYSKVMPSGGDIHYNKYKKKRVIEFKATLDQHLEIARLYAAYKPELAKEIELTLSAFIHTNHIYPSDTPSSDRELTPQEMQELRVIALRCMSMSSTDVHLELETQQS